MDLVTEINHNCCFGFLVLILGMEMVMADGLRIEKRSENDDMVIVSY
jgi:hypothetical protein